MASAELPARPAPPPDDENTPEYREWLAAAFDTDVYEQWIKPFEELLYRRIEPPGKGMALEVGCATGRGTARLMAALGDRVRLVAQEGRGFLLDLARARMGDQVGSRLFFNSDPLPRLRYDAQVFSTVVANLAWWEREDRASLLSEIARVLDADGTVLLTAPLAGTFGELIDLAREVAVKLDVAAKLEPRIAALEQLFPTPEDWAAEVEAAGLVHPRVDCDEIELQFSSSRELFSSTVAQARWIGLWRRAFGDEDKRLVWHIRQMIDAYWADSKFTLTVAAGCLTARRPEGWTAPRPVAPPSAEALSVPIVIDGESDADRAPARPTTIPPARRDSYYASGDAIAAELLGLDGGPRPDERPAPAPAEVEPAEPVDVEPVEAEPLEAEPLEADVDEEPAPAPRYFDPLDEDEPYVPDEADVHSRPPDEPGERPSNADLEELLDAGSGIELGPAFPSEQPPPVDPLPLGRPQAVPVEPFDLGEPQLSPIEPVDLDELGPDTDASMPDWDEKKR